MNERYEEVILDDDSPIMVYEGEPSDVAFLTSLLSSAGIVIVVTSGRLFGSRELYVRRSDEPAARDLVADFESNRKPRSGRAYVLRGPWPRSDH